jgi:hypothetical protein
VQQIYPLKMNLTLEIRMDRKRNLQILLSILPFLLCDLEWSSELRREFASYLKNVVNLS